MKAALIVALSVALAACTPQVCVQKGIVDVDDYMSVPQFMPGPNGTTQMTMTQQWVGSHREIGCVKWEDAPRK